MLFNWQIYARQTPLLTQTQLGITRKLWTKVVGLNRVRNVTEYGVLFLLSTDSEYLTSVPSQWLTPRFGMASH